MIEDRRNSFLSSSSSLSEQSVNSLISNQFNSFESTRQVNNDHEIELTNERKKSIDICDDFLFLGPLILCLILLISGIILFILVGERHNQHHKQEKISNQLSSSSSFNSTFNGLFSFYSSSHLIEKRILDSTIPIMCLFNESPYTHQMFIAYAFLSCGAYRSSIFHIYYPNDSFPIHRGQLISIDDRKIIPQIELNWVYLSQFSSQSFVLLFLDAINPLLNSPLIVLFWIRYFSMIVPDGYDICPYHQLKHSSNLIQNKLLFLFTTNSTERMIRAKTICFIQSEPFLLSNYLSFNKLELVATTYFRISQHQSKS